MSIRIQHPLPGSTPTDPFGWRAAIPGVIGAQLHNGQDWAAPRGTPILAAHDGQVRNVWWDATGGWMVKLGTANFSTNYAHMMEASPLKPGQYVNAGDVIGYVGSTGASTGPHLHFSLILPGGFVDPLPYLTSTPKPEEKEEDTLMNRAMYYMVGKVYHVVIGCLESGFKLEYTTGDSGYNNRKAEQFKTGSFSQEDKSVYDKFCAALDAVRIGK